MADSTQPLQSFVPLPPQSENKIKKTLKLFKDSWRALSGAQKSQLVVVLALVLGLPAILGGVYTVKLFAPKAEVPVTSPITPPTTPTPVPITPPITPTPTVTPKPVCAIGRQTVSLTPQSQSGYAGSPLLYYIAVKNNDSTTGCSKTGFTLSALADTGWLVGLSNTILTLDPGATGTAQVIFTSSKTAKPGSYPVSVGATSSRSGTVYANSAYMVLATPTPTATPVPRCNMACANNSQCSQGLFCYKGVCRNQPCTTKTDCVCPTPTPTPKPTVKPTPTPTPHCRFSILGRCIIP